MDNKELIKQAYKEISPSEELVERTVERGRSKAAEREARRGRFSPRRGAAIAVSIGAACALTVSAAAVGGLLDLNSLFGGRYKADNDRVAENIVRDGTNVSGFAYSVDNDDYYIELKGVAGDAKNVMVSTVLKRKDGEPVLPHFDDETVLYYKKPLYSNYSAIPFEELDCRYSQYHGAFIDDEGNIEMNTDFLSNSVLSGKKLRVEGRRFYVMDDDTNVTSVLDFDGTYHAINHKPITEEFTVLDIDWSFEFDYSVSGELLASKSCGIQEKKFPYYETLYDETASGEWADIGEYELSATLLSADISAANGFIKFEFPDEKPRQYEMTDKACVYISDRNEISLIRTDGTVLPAAMDFGNITYNSAAFLVTYNFHYGEKAPEITEEFDHGGKPYFPEKGAVVKDIIDPSEIAAISINGTVYELS